MTIDEFALDLDPSVSRRIKYAYHMGYEAGYAKAKRQFEPKKKRVLCSWCGALTAGESIHYHCALVKAGLDDH